MKKYGKYEKRPEGVPVKQPKVKSMLLQTYFTSLICLVLCVSMFFGTSYAWFTSEVNNEANEIYVGTLKVGLYKDSKDLETGSVKQLDLADSTKGYKLFEDAIRWEPGYTALETVHVVNEGDLAFEYEMTFTDGSLVNGTSAELAEIAKYFDVWVFSHVRNTYTAPASYEGITEAAGWTKLGNLAEVLTGKTVLSGDMITVRKAGQDATAVNPGTTDGVRTTDTFTVALHMSELAGFEAMGKRINLNVKLIAYQKGYEKDAFGNSNYDNVSFVSTIEQLQNALNSATSGEIINLADDITGNATVTQKENVAITIEGNGKTFTGELLVSGQSERYETSALTVQNVNFVANPGSDAVIRLGKDDSTRYTNNVTVRDCTFVGTDEKAAAVRTVTGGDWNLTIDGCTVNAGMHSLVQLKNVEQGLKITDCKVYSKNGANLNNTYAMEMSGCTFDVKGYAVRFGEGSEASDYVEVFNISDSTLKSACAASDDAVIVFRGSCLNSTLNLTNTTLEGAVKVLGNTEATTINGLN